MNPNGSQPEVMLAAVCTFLEIRDQVLCNDPTGLERAKFISLVNLANSLGYGIPGSRAPATSSTSSRDPARSSSSSSRFYRPWA